MGKYFLTSRFFSDKIEIHIPQSLSGGGSLATVVYESPGSNGGIIINTGRLNESLSVGGKILSKFKFPASIETVQDDVNNRASELQDVKDFGYPVVVEGSLPTNKTGEYIVTEFLWTKAEGQRKYVGFTMTFQEHRQVNIKRNSINLVGSEAVRASIEAAVLRKNIGAS